MANKIRIYFWSVVAIACLTVMVYKYLTKDKRAYEAVKKKNWSISYERFIREYPNSKYVNNAYLDLYNLVFHHTYGGSPSDWTKVDDLKLYLSKYQSSPYKNLAINKIISICDSLYHLAQYRKDTISWGNYLYIVSDVKLNGFREKFDFVCDSLYDLALIEDTKESWVNYIGMVPNFKIKDAKKRIQQIEDKQWETDLKAWSKASTLGTIEGYQKYLSIYPNGKYRNTADKRLIDLEVSRILRLPHGFLPGMDKISSNQYKKTSSIEIENQTSYTLTILYSGNDSRRITIPSKKQEWWNLLTENIVLLQLLMLLVLAHMLVQKG